MDNKTDDIIFDKNEEKKIYSWNIEGTKILNSPKKYLTDEERTIIRYCFQKPLPDNLREKYWLLITGAKELKINNPNYYNTLLNNYPVNPISERNENQILLDINRTFPEDENFNEEKKISLKNILKAFSRRNCTLGYCQGFNYIVGKILKVINNEEDAFWIFTQIIENILPINYFYDSIGLIIDNNILVDILKDVDKELIEHFSKYNFELLIKNILYKWLICLFSQNIKDELLFIIWDIFFFEGTPILFKTIILIFEKIRNQLLEITKIDKLVNLFESVHSLNLLNPHKEELLKDLLKYNGKINNILVIKGRKKWHKNVKDSMKVIKKRFNDININNCSEDWDNCSYIKYKYDCDDFVVYQKAEKMEIIENYYIKKTERCNSTKSKGNERNFKRKMNEFNEYEKLIVQRRIHECPDIIKKRKKEKTKSCNSNRNVGEKLLNESYKPKKIKKLKKIEDNNIKGIPSKNNNDSDEDDFMYNYLNML